VNPLPSSFVRTRLVVHTLAEHVLCATRYAAVGRVGLAPSVDGIATPPFDGRVVGLRGVDLFDDTTDGSRQTEATTLRAAGEFLGVVPGAPALWTPTTSGDLDAVLEIDADGVAALAAWFTLVSGALAATFPEAPQTLWPEHFDLAVTVDDAIYGGSPGDADHPQPYLYVVPPADAALDGDRRFWNEPFGASFPYDRINGPDDATGFLSAASTRLAKTTEGTERP
jgi:hypothetical protein